MAKPIIREIVDPRVEDELWNWSRWCWQGEWPHPLPPTSCGSGERNFPSGIDRESDEPPPRPPILVHRDRALKIHGIYKRLHLVEQRVMQFEYPRRHELGDLTRPQRYAKAADKIGIPVALYRDILAKVKSRVREAMV